MAASQAGAEGHAGVADRTAKRTLSPVRPRLQEAGAGDAAGRGPASLRTHAPGDYVLNGEVSATRYAQTSVSAERV